MDEMQNKETNRPRQSQKSVLFQFCVFFILFLPIWVSFVGPCLCLCVCVCMCLRVCVGSCAFSQSVLCSVFLSAHEPGAWRDLLGTGVNELCLRKSQIQNVCEHNCTQSHTSLLVFHPVKEQSILPLCSGKNQRSYFLTLFRCPSISTELNWTGNSSLCRSNKLEFACTFIPLHLIHPAKVVRRYELLLSPLNLIPPHPLTKPKYRTPTFVQDDKWSSDCCGFHVKNRWLEGFLSYVKPRRSLKELLPLCD